MLAIMSKSSYHYNLANGMGAVLDFNPHGDADIDIFIKLNEVKIITGNPLNSLEKKEVLVLS